MSRSEASETFLYVSVPACVALLVMTSRLETKLVSVTKDHVTALFWVTHK